MTKNELVKLTYKEYADEINGFTLEKIDDLLKYRVSCGKSDAAFYGNISEERKEFFEEKGLFVKVYSFKKINSIVHTGPIHITRISWF